METIPKHKYNVDLIGFDFDSTLTLKDTIDILVNANPKSKDKQFQTSWQNCIDLYLVDYQQAKDEATNLFLQTLKEDNVALGSIWNIEDSGTSSSKFKALLKYTQAFKAAELKSLSRVESSKLLEGISLSHLESASQKIELRKGCLQFLDKVQHNSTENHSIEFNKVFNLNLLHFKKLETLHQVNILSVNWSLEFIQLSLRAKLGIGYYANKLQFVDGITTGSIEKKMVVGDEKWQVFEQLKAKFQKVVGKDPKTMFLGDSVSDLPSIVSSDHGILINQQLSSSIKWLCDSLGIKIIEGLLTQDKVVHQKVIYWVKDFEF